MTTIQDVRLINSNRDRYESMIRSRGEIKREIAYFEENIGNIKSIEDFMKDDRIYRFVMEAFDLEPMTYARGLIRKVLEEGVEEKTAIANKLSDKKFKQMAEVLGFAEDGGASLQDETVVQSIVDRFVEVNLEVDSEEKNPAVRLALYFQRKAEGITNWYQVIADDALREVVFTTFGYPDEMALTDVDKLAATLKKRYEIEDFQDPEKLKKFVDQFSVMYDMENGYSSGSSLSTIALPTVINSSSRSSIISIDQSVLQTLLSIPKFY